LFRGNEVSVDLPALRFTIAIMKTTTIEDFGTLGQFAKETGIPYQTACYHAGRIGIQPVGRVGITRVYRRSDFIELKKEIPLGKTK
jgi:hypothetical protein